MQFRLPSTLFVALALAAATSSSFVEAGRSSGRSGGRAPPSRGASSKRSGSAGRGSRSSSRKPAATPRGRKRADYYDDEPEEDEFDFGGFPGDEDEDDYDAEELNAYDMEDDAYDEYDAEYEREIRGPSRAKPSPRGGRASAANNRGSSNSKRGGNGSRGAGASRGRGAEARGRGSSSGSNRGGRVVNYGGRRNAPQPGAFTRGLSALRESIPDPTSIKDAAFNSVSAVKETSSKLSSNLYREIKGLTSSELEQVMLKATQPNDTAVKGKHVERLVGVTYQISGRYDIYDAVLRKLWGKMVEKDWRTNVKALYILHRFSADGAPDHQAALKARLRELRRTRDPKRKEKYFNSKQLLAGDSTPANIAFRAFLGRYAHYVLLRAQCFGGVFREIATEPTTPKPQKGKRPQPKKVITSTCLKNEHLEAAQILLKAGLACALKEEEECENTAIAYERVVSDMIGLTTAVATALNSALKSGDDGLDRDLIQKWCEFYSDELLPQAKSMVKSSAPMLDVYGLYLPSRMGASVSQDLLKKGLQGSGDADDGAEEAPPQEEENVCREEDSEVVEDRAAEEEEEESPEEDINENLYDEYEYDEYEYDEY